MVDKITLANFTSFQNDTSAVATINNNNALVTTAFDNTLSRDGTSPNQMGSDLDMNNFQIINLPAPGSVYSPARLIDVTSNPTITVPPVFVGTGVPTLSAAQGSLYLRSDGSSTSTRVYVNTNGTTGWTNLVTAT